jgi:copper chaperone CopZ
MTRTHVKIVLFDNLTDSGHLEKSLEAVPGVVSVEFAPDVQEVIILHEGADMQRLAAAIAQLGYQTLR